MVQDLPLTCVEMLLRHPALPVTMPVVPALLQPPRPGAPTSWTFRPSVLADLLDAYADSRDTEARTAYRYEEDHVVLTGPAGHTTTALRVSEDLPHCAPPQAITTRLAPDDWMLAVDQLPEFRSGAGSELAIVATQAGRGVEEWYVDAPADIERLDPGTWVYINARWSVPARAGSLLVPAGQVALYQPAINAEPMPEQFADGEDWLPDCRYCGELLIDSGCVPGMRYPEPDLGAGELPWCGENPRQDRHRPHAAVWRVSRQSEPSLPTE